MTDSDIRNLKREAHSLYKTYVKKTPDGSYQMLDNFRRISRSEGRKEGKSIKKLSNVPSKKAINNIATMFNIPKDEIDYNIDVNGFMKMISKGVAMKAQEMKKNIIQTNNKHKDDLVKMKHKIEERERNTKPNDSEHKFLTDEFKKRIVENGIKQGLYLEPVADIREWIVKLDPKITDILSEAELVRCVEDIKNKGTNEWIKKYRKNKDLGKNAQVIRDNIELGPEAEEVLQKAENEYNSRKERVKNKKYLLPQQTHPTDIVNNRRKSGINENLYRGAYRKL